MKPARFLFNDPEQETRKGQGDCKNQPRVADTQTSDMLNPFLKRAFLVVSVGDAAATLIYNRGRTRRRDGLFRQHKRLAVPAHARSYENTFGRLELNPHSESVFCRVVRVDSNAKPQEHLRQRSTTFREFRHSDNELLNAAILVTSLHETANISAIQLARDGCHLKG